MESDLKPMDFFVCPSCYVKVGYDMDSSKMVCCPACNHVILRKDLVKKTCRYGITANFICASGADDYDEYTVWVWFAAPGGYYQRICPFSYWADLDDAYEGEAYRSAIQFIRDDKRYQVYYTHAEFDETIIKGKVNACKTRWDFLEI